MIGPRRKEAWSRGVSAVVAVALALPTMARAEEPSRAAPAPESADPAEEEARSLYNEGTVQYSTSNYARAVDAFTEAYRVAAEMTDNARREQVMNTLLFNLARAHFKAYDVDQDAEHLRKTKDLLQKYLTKQEDLGDELDAEILLKKTDVRLAEIGAKGETAASRQPAAGPSRSPTDRPPTNGLMIGGIVTSVVGLAGLGVMVAGLVKASRAVDTFETEPLERDQARDDIKAGNRMAIGAGVAGGLVLAAGAVMLALGLRKRSQRMALAPTGTGAAWVVRF